MQKKYLTVPFVFTKAESVPEDEYFRFEGYASTYDLDLGKDKVVAGAFRKFLDRTQGKSVKIFYQHNINELPLGVPEDLKEDSRGLFIKVKMPKELSMAKDIMALMRCGAIDSMSIGYLPVKYDYDKDGVRLLKEIDLYEVSLVTMPMNPGAVVTALKSVGASKNLPLCDREHPWKKRTAELRVRKFTKSVDAPTQAYKKAFMYYDSERADDFTAYKLPFADVVNGKLCAVPRALFAIAAALDGARGGVDIPKSDKKRIKGIVESYYRKMDMESPFKNKEGKKFFRRDVQNIKTKREFERCLRESGAFSTQAAIKLASFFMHSRELSDEDKVIRKMQHLTEALNTL
jgi:HK97 family phage prohead protease